MGDSARQRRDAARLRRKLRSRASPQARRLGYRSGVPASGARLQGLAEPPRGAENVVPAARTASGLTPRSRKGAPGTRLAGDEMVLHRPGGSVRNGGLGLCFSVKHENFACKGGGELSPTVC